jgi:preprotein translocase subunit SecY
MLEKLRVVFTIPELRRKILLTLFLLAIYRVGWQIPLPMIDQAKMEAVSQTCRADGENSWKRPLCLVPAN